MKTTIEKSIFQFTLVLACIYQVYQLINGVILSSEVIPFNSGILALLVAMYIISFKVKSIQYLAFFLHLIILPVLIYFWAKFGGFSGTVPLVLFVYVGWIILTLRGVLQIVTVGIYLMAFLLLTQFPNLTGVPVADPGKVNMAQLAIDFFVIALIVTAFLIYIKNRLMGYRRRIGHRNQQLDTLSTMLLTQKDKLQYNHEEIRLINGNLEQIIEGRIQKIEEKNAQLEEYAFINAHILRGPLCRIMGLTALMQRNGHAAELTQIYEKAVKVDSIIKRINEITR